MNHLLIIGNLAADPQSRTTQTGKQVCNFTVCVARRNDREKSDFFRVSAWGELGNNCCRYLAKGRKVAVSGTVSASAYTMQNGETRANLDVFADAVEFLSPRESAPQNVPEAQETDREKGFVKVDESLPF